MANHHQAEQDTSNHPHNAIKRRPIPFASVFATYINPPLILSVASHELAKLSNVVRLQNLSCAFEVYQGDFISLNDCVLIRPSHLFLIYVKQIKLETLPENLLAYLSET